MPRLTVPGSCLLTFYRKMLVAETWKVLPFKIHFVTLLNKKWQTDKSWKKLTHSPEDSQEQLWPGTVTWDTKVSWCGPEVLLPNGRFGSSGYQTGGCFWKEGPLIARQPLPCLSFQGSVPHAQNSNKLPNSLLYIPIS